MARGRPPGSRNAVATRQESAPPPAVNEFHQALAEYRPQIKAVLPPAIPLQYFERVAMTAIAERPELLNANRRTLFLALVKAASDGLMPDGRDGVLNIYRTKVKQRDPNSGLDVERQIDVVQWQRMVGGVRRMMRNSGEVLSATAEAVYSNDEFDYSLGDEAFITHKPAKLGQPRGDLIGAYAIIRLSNGEVLRDVMGRPEIEAARNKNRFWQSSLMWNEFPWEGYKKTVLLRLSKAAPKSAGFEQINRYDEDEDEDIDLSSAPAIEAQEREPEPERKPPTATRETPRPVTPEFAIVDSDGVEHVFESAYRARDGLVAVLEDAAKADERALDTAWDNNQALIEALSANHGEAVAELASRYDELRAGLRAKPPEGAAPAVATALAQQPAAAVAEQQPRRLVCPAGGECAYTPRECANGLSCRRAPAAGTAAPSSAEIAGHMTDEALQAPPAREEPPPSNEPPNSEATHSAPPGAAAQSVSPQPEPTSDRPILHIPMVTTKGSPNCGTWVRALFIPRSRRQTAETIPFFLGDNEAEIELCRKPGALTADDLKMLNSTIEQLRSQV